MTAKDVKIPEKERKEPDPVKNAPEWTEFHLLKNAIRREVGRWVSDLDQDLAIRQQMHKVDQFKSWLQLRLLVLVQSKEPFPKSAHPGCNITQ